MREQQTSRMAVGRGFIAALDQSGGSTPGALRRYGIAEGSYPESEMFDLVHAMRERIVTSPAFSGDQILAAILFENTLDRTFAGRPATDYLWQEKSIVTFLKVDRGLAEAADGVQLMKPIPDLDSLLQRARAEQVFGTKMRSVIHQANPVGIREIVRQQVEIGRTIAAAGLVPILEPEVDIHASDKGQCEEILLAELDAGLTAGWFDGPVMLKLTLPETDDFYAPLITHPAVLRVAALSGGFSRDEACQRLARNHGLIASFSRALTEGLHVDQSAAEFDAMLAAAINSIWEASIT